MRAKKGQKRFQSAKLIAWSATATVMILVGSSTTAATTSKIDSHRAARSNPQLRHSVHRKPLTMDEMKFVSARRLFGLAQDRLHQVAAATAPQTRDLLTPY